MWPMGGPVPPPVVDDHRCPLLPLTDEEAIRVLVECLRTADSASALVARLGRRGLRVGRVPR